MPDPHPVDVETLRARLPGEWRVERDGGVVRGRGAVPTSNAPSTGWASAVFTIRPEGDLWAATWRQHSDPGRAPEAAVEEVTGVRERCAVWVVAKARSAGGPVRVG